MGFKSTCGSIARHKHTRGKKEGKRWVVLWGWGTLGSQAEAELSPLLEKTCPRHPAGYREMGESGGGGPRVVTFP